MGGLDPLRGKSNLRSISKPTERIGNTQCVINIHSQPYPVGSSSDVAFWCQYCSDLLALLGHITECIQLLVFSK